MTRVFATLAGLMFRYRPGVPLYPLLAGALAGCQSAAPWRCAIPEG